MLTTSFDEVKKLRRSTINHLLTPEKQRIDSLFQVSENAENKNVVDYLRSTAFF